MREKFIVMLCERDGGEIYCHGGEMWEKIFKCRILDTCNYGCCDLTALFFQFPQPQAPQPVKGTAE